MTGIMMDKTRRSLKLLMAAFGTISTVLGLVVVGASAPAFAADARAKIVGTDYDQNGIKVILRQGVYSGGKGFGWEKIQRRHAIYDKDTLGFVLHEPYPNYSGSIAEYNAYANKFVDGKPVDSREVKVVFERKNVTSYYGVTINGQVGIITAFCVNPGGALACPSWVDYALGKRTANAEGGTAEVVWSYEAQASANTSRED
ncbi:MAG: hypothetical protein LH624_00815 [Cryobacterium sp.]|nr:hypothetical protein [Cryobacterium sp.]